MACPYQDDFLEGELQTKEVYYGDYLNLENILGGVKLESAKPGRTLAHEEHLFIVTHQAFELWFKQVIWELDSICEIFKANPIEEKMMLIVDGRLERIVEIFKVLVDQFRILESMDALDFLEYRKYLSPASGFQSVQFRLIENKLGLLKSNRNTYQQQHYKEYFSTRDAGLLEVSEKEPTLLSLVEKWLERTPGLSGVNYSFWNEYQKAVHKMHEDMIQEVRQNPHLSDEVKAKQETVLLKAEDSFRQFIEQDRFEKQLEDGLYRFSHKALQGAIMIFHYRFEPKFHLPYKMLNLLMEIDTLMYKFRMQHVLLVQKMIGSKVGTGGSSGYLYLRSTLTDKYKVFLDLFNLSTFLLPRDYVPELPAEVRRKLNFWEEQ